MKPGQAEKVQAPDRTDAAVVEGGTVLTEGLGYLDPGVVGAESGRPDHCGGLQ